jgi:metal-responsive CopG/Arc/MetJ family transcriptional regulator
VTRRRIEPRPAVELETVSLRLPAELVRTVDDYAKYLGGSTDRTYVITQALELALERDPEFQKRRQARPATAPATPARGAI